MDVIEQSVSELEVKTEQFRAAMDPAAASAAIAARVSQFSARFSDADAGIDLTPEDIRQKFDARARQQYDEQLRADAEALDAELRSTADALDAAEAAAASLPHPIDGLRPMGETAMEVAKLRTWYELDSAARRFEGKTVADVARTYEATRDDRDGGLTWFIETELANGWPSVRLTSRDDDAGAILKLRGLVKDRQAARVKAGFPHLAAARAKLATLRTAQLDSQIRHLVNDRRGLAAVTR